MARSFDSVVKQMVELYNQGYTVGEVARAVGYSYDTVLKYLKRSGVEMRHGQAPRNPVVVCPRCGRPGRVVVSTRKLHNGDKKIVFVTHKWPGRCYIAALEKIHQYPHVAEAIAKLTQH
ncbi:MAG: helix-turn-helix domain-containing protein [Pyrobaculum sp.]